MSELPKPEVGHAPRPPRARRARQLRFAAAAALAALGIGYLLLRRLHGLGLDLVRVPSGSFEMGSADGEPDERPPRRVQVPGFEIDRQEATLAGYQLCVRAGRCAPPGSAHPKCTAKRADATREAINCITFGDAQAYCAWRGMRLPSEKEWEYAARGPESRRYPWGNQPNPQASCWNRESLGSCSVGSFPLDRSPFGVLDLGGNLAEWTESPYCADQAHCKPGTRVVKGGSWDMTFEFWLRASYRDFLKESERGTNIGARCVRSPSAR